jgi:hypothetical protein
MDKIKLQCEYIRQLKQLLSLPYLTEKDKIKIKVLLRQNLFRLEIFLHQEDHEAANGADFYRMASHKLDAGEVFLNK